MTTKAELEVAVEDLNKRLNISLSRQHALVSEKNELERDVNVFRNEARNRQGQIDHTRHAIEAFVAAECPNLDLNKVTLPQIPTSIMHAMGVRPAEPSAPSKGMGAPRDIVADMLKHLHGLVS